MTLHGIDVVSSNQFVKTMQEKRLVGGHKTTQTSSFSKYYSLIQLLQDYRNK